MDQIEKTRAFRSLHVRGAPLVLWNIWDAGSAKAVAGAGAAAVATGSWAVAAAQGYSDGESLPMAAAVTVARQVSGAVDVPVSVDFEAGYAVGPEGVFANVSLLIGTGIAGLNIEDRIVGTNRLYPVEEHSARIAAARRAAEAEGVPVFINARTDVFFREDKAGVAELTREVLARAAAYAGAGADGLFLPGVSDPEVIATICAGQSLPVNVMRRLDGPDIGVLAQAGVARISHGPAPYLAAMEAFGAKALL